MNPVESKVEAMLNELPDCVEPIRSLAQRLKGRCSVVDPDGTIKIGHRPWEAPENYAITLFAGVKRPWFQRYVSSPHGVEIPQPLQRVLMAVNGCFADEFSLFGIPPSMLSGVPMLDRSRLAPLDIGTAVTSWAINFGSPRDAFHFACRNISHDDQAGYFLNSDGSVSAIRRLTGQEFARWDSIQAMLTTELAAIEEHLRTSVPEDWWH